ncbi:variable large family protein (plasmid) [Borreliella burgdorferi]|uniref:variable large family protein n=1 Tax=Borreliella burgdorferi TaxID=139 RepID=UPI003AF1DF64
MLLLKGRIIKRAGKLFGKAGDDANGDSEAASKAAGAVSAVSGEQILSAIVKAADAADQDGKKPGDATNPIAAAIGKGNADAGADFDKEGMKKDDQIAAAIALRGMAKDGKFAVKSDDEKEKAEGAIKGAAAIGEVVANDGDAKAADKASVTGIAKGIKEIVEAAGGSEKLKVAAATGENNKEAGKLFGKVDAANAGDSEAASKAAGAVSAVSGEQILSAIVTAAGEAEQEGKKPADATNPIAAAIGKGNADDGAEFNKEGMKKDDQIAAAIALRGMAKDGKFAVKNGGEKEKAEGAIKEVSELLDKLVKAVKTAEGASSGTAAIGEVVANDGAAKAADKDSVKGIAKGIKEIVEAAGGSEKLKAAAAEGENNKKAGKLFGKAGAAAGANGDSEAASKAAGAVSAVSGEQILSAIVTAAGEADQEGKKPEEATNPIAAAIGKGNADDGAEFGKDEMKKDDQIAAAIALRGMAKDGKFAVKNGGDEKGKAEGAIKEVSELLDKLVKAVKTAEGASRGTAAIGEVVADAAKAADKDSVKGIAKGIKEIVEAAGGSEKLKVAAAKEGNEKAGKLFGKVDANNAGDSEAASKAAGAVSAVSGEQILSAIVTAAGAADQDGEKPAEATNPIAAAIGKGNAENGAEFGDGMKKDDQIAAAIALRGMAKDGKFAVKGNNEKGKAEGAIKEVSELLDKLVKAVKTAEGASSGTAAIGEVVANDGDAKAADKDSVKGIAKGIKEIVEAAGGSEKLKAAAAKEGNEKAGKLFGKVDAAHAGDSEAASKAAGAVSAVSGEQILSAIVTAAGAGEAEQEGKKPGDAKNPIAAAIGKGDAENGAEFGKDEMKKDDQIAAAIALRGMAKDGKFAVKGNNEKGKAEGAIKEVSELLDKLVKAVKTAEGASSGTDAIGEVVANDGDAKAADKASVTGIAKGIKEIVEAAGGSEKLKVAAAKGENNKGAGKLFGKAGDDANGDSEAASKAAGAVSAVSGEQILSAIVKAADAADQDGKKPGDATNPIAAAIGNKDEDGAEFNNEMKKDDQIAAAIALRGMAKDGKFAVKSDDEKEKAEGASSGTAAIGEVVANDGDAKAADKASVTGIAKGIKEIVEAAGGSEKLKVAAATGENNKEAGKLFGKVDAANAGDSEAASKAAGAVSAVSGEQILSAIVTAAGEAEQEGKKPADATNPIAAAIGKGNADDGAEFNKEGMKKDDQIAAAIALRGMAKDGKFAVKNGGEKEKAEGAIKEVSELLDKLVKAVKTAEGASSGTAAIGEVVANDGAAKAADKDSVKGIAKGIKEIVEAAGGSEKLKAAAAEGENNKKAGKLFGKAGAAAGANGDSEAASKAAGAVSAVSGEQILSAIVTAAGEADQEGKKPEEATNPIAAAIGKGNADDGAEFGKDEMKKDDQIAAAIALRGMAKDGKFAVKNGGDEKGKAEGAIKEVSELLDKLVKAVKTAEGASSGTAAIGEVVADAAKAADKDSVKGIAKGIKEIVEAAGGSEKLKVAAAKEGNEKAGKLFGKVDANNAGDSEAASKAAGAVSAVSGEQILSAIVTAAGAADQDGKKPGDATNPIAAAIGKGDEEDGADFDNEMKKDDQIAAAIALRGMAKDGKFAVKGNNEKGKAEGAIKEVSELLDKLVKAVKTAEGASSGTAAIGEVVANDGDAKAADKDSVKGIAKGIKEIVEAAGGSEKLKAAAAKEGNEKAGKLFGKVDAAHAGDSEAASKAAGAVSAVSGEQILSAIVTAAGAAEQEGKKPGDATNPIAAAIGKGNAENGADFNNEGMKKDNQIAAAIALRGMAKDGKFAVKSDDEKGKAEGAIKEVSELLDKLVKAVKTAEGASSGTAAIGEVVDNDAAAKVADKDSVTGIAKGIKEIVEAAGGSEKLKAVAAAKEGNKEAGKLFGKVDANNAGDSEAASKAAGAVSAVSGEQIY